MRNINRNLFIASFVLLMFMFCDQNKSKTFEHDMSPKTVQFAKEFPRNIQLKNKVEIKINEIGIISYQILDSILCLSTSNSEGYWRMYSLPEMHKIGQFLTKGKGPYEFIFPPIISGLKVNFLKQNDSIFAYIRTTNTGRIYQMNVTKSLNQDQLDIKTIKEGLPKNLFNSIILDSSYSIFYKEFYPIGGKGGTKQIRKLFKNDKQINNPFIDKLNKVEIKEGEDINLLATYTGYDHKNKRLIEASTYLNLINIYSLNGDFGKTVVVGDGALHLEEIQNIDKWERLLTFSTLRIYNNFFGVVLKNISEKSDQINRNIDPLPCILLFDLDGNPIAKLEVDHFIDDFDIDMQNGELYTFNGVTEQMYKYDVSSFINKLESDSSNTYQR